jgi:hypothetical protein
MRSRRQAAFLFIVPAALLLSLASPAQAQCPLVPLIDNYIEIDQFPDSSAVVELNGPNGTERINLRGPSTVHVAIGPNGEATDTDGDNLDQVKTEMVQLDLSGSSSMGTVHVGIRPITKDPFQCSDGEIEETANTQSGRLDVPPFAPSGTAVSTFRIFFEITVGSVVLHNRQPKIMQSLIRHKPPMEGDVYENPQVIPLYFEDNTLSPYTLGSARHVPNPEGVPPVCVVTFVTGGVDVSVSDAGTGLSTIQVTRKENATVNVPGFPVGSKGPVVVTARKDDPIPRSVLELKITDLSGNMIVCDPILTLQIREHGKPESEKVSGLPQAEGKVTVLNGSPGLSTLRIEVNGRPFVLTGMGEGEPRTLDISSALRPGNDNVVTLTASGRPGGSAEVIIHD